MLGGDTEIATCKIIDYSKYLYEKQKKDKIRPIDKNQLKEVRLRPGIDVNDLKTKAKIVDRIIESGYKVRVSITYSGRGIKYLENGYKKVDCLLDMLVSEYVIINKAETKGNKVITVLGKK